MPLRIRYQYPTGSSLGYSVERLSDGAFLDFNDSTFKASPTTLIAPIPEDRGSFAGRYKLTLASTPASQFTDGDYVVTVHNIASSNVVVGQLAVVMHSGDDSTVFPGGSVDPWSAALPGVYAPGTAGAVVGGNLDARVSSRSTYAGGPVAGVTAPVTVGTNNDKAGYGLSPAERTTLSNLLLSLADDPWSVALPGGYASGTAGAVVGGNLDARVSSRSTYAGGPVAGVTAPVTVGTNNDKAGYALGPAGLDPIQVESGVNARQALAPILAASAGVLLGAGTGTIVIKGGNVAVTRVTATTDNAGNRTAVVLSLPT